MSGDLVQILLSSYNGEKYLRVQLDSILSQTHQNLKVLVRDDGSTDGTREILREYEAKEPRIRVIYGENVGLVQSFFRLLEVSDADFVGFSDQDDQWLPDKVETAWRKIAQISGPALYSSNQILVDQDLNPLPEGKELPDPRPGFANAVVESMCTGCTVLMNRTLVDALKRAGLPEHAIWHDWWCYLACTYCGTYVFDRGAHILYRQHGGNRLGSSRSALVMIRNKWEFLKETRGQLGAMLREFQARFRGEAEKDALVDLVLASEKSLSARLRLAFGHQVYRQKPLDGLVTRVLFLIGKML